MILDLDGTLVDSEALIVENLALALASVGAPALGSEEMRSFVGPDLRDVMSGLGLEPDVALRAIEAYRTSYDPVADQALVFPGIHQALDRLVGAGLTLAVATAKPEALAATVCATAGLDTRLSLVAGADHDSGRSSKAAVIASALDRLAATADAGAVVMVGDRRHDVEGAAAHGILTIGVSWGSAAPGELESAGATAIVNTPEELTEALLLCHRAQR